MNYKVGDWAPNNWGLPVGPKAFPDQCDNCYWSDEAYVIIINGRCDICQCTSTLEVPNVPA